MLGWEWNLGSLPPVQGPSPAKKAMAIVEETFLSPINSKWWPYSEALPPGQTCSLC